MSDEKIVGIVNDLFGAGTLIFFFFYMLNDLTERDLFMDKEKSFCPQRENFPLLGFDTISTALSWSVMYMVAYPEIQERLYQELSEYKYLLRFYVYLVGQ